MSYTTRVIESRIRDALNTVGGVLIEGPRACGKTSTALRFAASNLRLDVDDQARELASLAPQALFDRPSPVLIDEWQLAPKIWNAVRNEIDARQLPGQFILTGSVSLDAASHQHTGAGRIMRVRMRPMTLFESGRSQGSTSLSKLLLGEFVPGTSTLTIPAIVDEICRGGLPALQTAQPIQAQRALASYLEDVKRRDFETIAPRLKRPERIDKILRSLARNVGSETSTAKLAAEISESDGKAIKAETLEKYLDTLRALFLVEDLPAWSPHLRSSYTLRKAAKRYFVDPAFAAVGLGASPSRLLADPNTLGFLFENLVIRDLRVFVDAIGGKIAHYRDSGGLEVDAIVTGPNSNWMAIEIKLNPDRVNEAAATLQNFEKRIDTAKSGKPIALAVVTTGEYSFRRDDGIYVVAIGTLGP